jgi:hypothetical protein
MRRVRDPAPCDLLKVAKSFALGFDGVCRILLAVAALASLLAACDLEDSPEYRLTLALDFQPNAVHTRACSR